MNNFLKLYPKVQSKTSLRYVGMFEFQMNNAVISFNNINICESSIEIKLKEDACISWSNNQDLALNTPQKKKKKEKQLKRKVLSLDTCRWQKLMEKATCPTRNFIYMAFFHSVLKLLKEVGFSVMWKKKILSKLVNVRTAAEIVWLESP